MMTKTTTTTTRGFGSLPCPLCGEWGKVAVELAELTRGDACHCQECDAEFGLEDVRAHLAAWQRVLAWIDAAPVLED